MSSKRQDRAWEPVTLVYGTYEDFLSDVLWHVRRTNPPVALPPGMKDFDDWDTTITRTVTNHLSNQVSYETWAILGVTPTKMALLVRMITAEIGRKE